MYKRIFSPRQSRGIPTPFSLQNIVSPKLFRQFFRDESGSITPLIVVALVFVIMPVIGVTLDFTRVIHTKSELQNKLDATTLAVAHMVDQDAIRKGNFHTERSRLEPIAKDYFSALMGKYKYLDKYENSLVALEKAKGYKPTTSMASQWIQYVSNERSSSQRGLL